MDLSPIPSPSAPDEQISIEEPLCAVFRRRLKADGQKYTPERARVLDAVIQINGMFEAEQLLTNLRNSGFRVSKATIYRTIKLMQDAGIVTRVLVDGDQPRFQLVYGSEPDDQIVVVDEERVISVRAPELVALRDRLAAEHGLRATGHRFQVFAVREAEPHD
ncbi:MAG: transcriptional repressor [Planctomycetota bacterium]